MPYAVKRRTARITFVDTEYDGAEMLCKFDVETETFLAYQRLQDETNVSTIAAVFKQFGDEILIEWDITEEDGSPIPATGIGMMRLPIAFAGKVVSRWLEEMAQPSVPLAQPSPNGNTWAGASAPTDESSPSPSS